MATSKIILTTDWQAVTDLGFVGQCRQSDSIFITNSDAVPAVDAVSHAITDTVNLQFPAPASGTWYAKSGNAADTVELVFTEV